MKRIFRIGSGLFIYSIIPILSWIVLGYVIGDNRISNVFSITFAIQFVWGVLKSFFGSGANIRKEKESDPNAVWNGIFWGTIFSVIIFSLPIIFVDNYISFFGQDVEFYRIYVIYSIELLFLQTLFSLVIEKLYFEDKEKLANIHVILFNSTSFVVLILSSLIFSNHLIPLLLTLGILFVYVICIYVWQFEKFKIDFTFFKNFKYESANIVTSIFSLIIYLFGFRNAFSAGEQYLAALNIIFLCTDAQWDMLEAVYMVSKIDIAKKRFDYNKQLRNAYIYASVVVTSSIVMAISLSLANGIDMNISLVYLTFQSFSMLLYPYKVILSTFTQLEYSATINTIINFSAIGLRTIISVSLMSPYCTVIGQLTQGVSCFVIFAIIKFVKYKMEDNHLVVKQSPNKDLQNK